MVCYVIMMMHIVFFPIYDNYVVSIAEEYQIHD